MAEPSKPATDPSLHLAAFLSAAREREVKVINGLLQQAEKFELCGLPTDGLAQITALKDELNAALKGMPPLDMVRCANDVGGTLEWLERSWQRCMEVYGITMEQLNKAVATVKGMKPAAELNALVTTEVEARVTTGALFTKEKHLDLLTGAEVAARKDGFAAGKTAALRTTELNTLGVASPSEELLTLPDDKYTARCAQAKKVVADLAALGLEPKGHLADLPWTDAETCAKRMADLKAGAKGGGDKPFREPMLPNGDPAPVTPATFAGCC